MSEELTVHGGSDRSIQSKENACRPEEMRETTPALRSPPPSSPWPPPSPTPPSPTPPLLYGLEDNEGLVAGVLQGKRLPFNSVNAKFFHDAFNHSEQRVLEHLCDALADAEPWWCQTSAGPSDKPSLSFSLFSLRVAAASGVSFVRCAHRHTTPLGEPTLVQPDPDDAWTSLADGLGVIWRAELAFSELLLHARRASLAGRPKPPNIVRWVKLRTCRAAAGKWCGLSTGQQG